MRYSLIEDLKPDTALPADAIHVALTQHAIGQLQRRSLPFMTLEDFYTSGEIRGDIDHFLHAQLHWFQSIDNYTQKLYPLAAELQVELASLYYYWIKYAVDNVILTTRILKRFLKDTAPAEIFFIHTPAPTDEIEHILSFRNLESTYSLLIHQICESERIVFHRITNNKTSGDDEQKKAFKTPGWRWLAPLKGKARSVHNSLQNFKDLRKTGCAEPMTRRVKVFLLKSSYHILDFCREAKDSGFEFYILEDDQVIKYDKLRRKRIVTLNRCFKHDVTRDEVYGKAEAAQDLAAINHWVDTQCELSACNVLASRFEKFFDDVCPRILSLIPGFINFYNTHQIDYVVTPSIWSVEDHAAIAAARKTSLTKCVGFNHGIDAFEAKSRFFKVTRFYDFFFVSTTEEAEHERAMVSEFDHEYPKVYPAKYFANKCKKVADKRKKNKQCRMQGKPVVVFIPIMCVPWPQRPIELTQPFPMEYVAWHRALADFMASNETFYFIWKGLYQPNQSYDYMADYIKRKKFANISFEAGKLDAWLTVASKVICDSPSTAFFETIYADLPILSLYRPNDQRLRNNALKAYGKSLVEYSTIEEGINKIDRFLHAPPAEYSVSIAEAATDVPALLRSETS